MDRVEAALERLAQAQARSEERLTRIEGILERTERVLAELTTQVKALSDNVGYGLEDIAPDVRLLYRSVSDGSCGGAHTLDRLLSADDGDAESSSSASAFAALKSRGRGDAPSPLLVGATTTDRYGSSPLSCGHSPSKI